MEPKIRKLYENFEYSTNSFEIEEKLMEFLPKTLEEFKAIPKIGDSFIENNIKKINKIIEFWNKNGLVKIDPSVNKNLNYFKSKLTNLSIRNNMIWNSKIAKSRLIDLTNLDEKKLSSIILNLNSNSDKKEELLLKDSFAKSLIKDVEFFGDNQNEKINWIKESYFNAIESKTKLFLEEKGRNLLYIAKWFIRGKIKTSEKEIPINAPLFLFPVNFENKESKKNIVNDKSRDVMINDFILTYILKKEYEYDYEISDIKNLKNLLSDTDIEFINKYNEDVEKFQELKSDTEELFLNKFEIKNNIVLGIFSGFGSSIRNEINEYIETQYLPKFLNNFLSSKNINDEEDLIFMDREFDENINNDEDLYFYNDLNFSQLEAIKKINSKKIYGLTIWGPPGTGKSETIISIIQDQYAKGKNILVVSEKQVALEVIKDRLDVLKDTSILISDTNDKHLFYDQVRKFNSFKVDLEKLENNINENEKLKNIYDEFQNIYHPPYEISKNLSDKKLSEIEKLVFDKAYYLKEDNEESFWKDEIENLKILDFNDLLNLKKQIDEIETLEQLIKYKEILSEFLPNGETLDELQKFYNKFLENLNTKLLMIQKDLIKFKSLSPIAFKQKKEIISKWISEDEMGKIGREYYYQIFENKISQNYSRIETFEKIKKYILDEYDLFKKFYEFDKRIYPLLELFNNENKKNNFKNQKFDLINSLINKYFMKNEFLLEREKTILNYEFLRKEERRINEERKLRNRNHIIEKIIWRKNKLSGLNNIEKIEKIINKKRPPQILKFIKNFSLELREAIGIWLLQPDSISTLIPKNYRFDLVIFDEASQMFLERSIPAISRAKKIVVIGDEKQLGPSNFFSGRITVDDEDELELENEDSLLTFAKSKLPNVKLRNHYRSEHISLINFSNDKYYEGSLNFINNNRVKVEGPIEYVKVDNANYINQTNEPEAKKVVEKLNEIYKNKPKITIGIITTNSKQAELIMNEIRFTSFELYKWLSEKANLFCKSIEDVQGDERDYIIISTTFGPDPNGVQRINFGPISNSLGSNRINVAITRSKKKMIVVSSIDIEQAKVKVVSSKNNGPRDFINFIEYSKNISEDSVTKNSSSKNEDQKIFRYSFEEEVFNEINGFLRKDYGIEIITQFKTLGYKIDFVLHDVKKNKNICALELDGTSFYSPYYARERDFDKQNFLESRGWKVYRIWSTNWWNDKKREIKKLKKYISDIYKEI